MQLPLDGGINSRIMVHKDAKVDILPPPVSVHELLQLPAQLNRIFSEEDI